MGFFITFEGCEGSGKSTQLRLLTEYLKQNNVDFVFAREPGGTAISERIREIILDKSNAQMSDECEALLYASARAQLLSEVVAPALKQGKLVILDRYIDSSFAYQAFARGLGFDYVSSINEFALKNFMPDLTIFLNIDPKSAFLRKGGVDESDRLELAGMEFHTKVYNGYMELSKMFKERFALIDCSGTKFETHQNIINLLKDRGIIVD